MRRTHTLLAPRLLAPVCALALSSVASAQFDKAREALARVEVVDAACHEAQEIFRSEATPEEKREALKKLKVQQEFRLLVNGVAVGPTEVVTRSLHPRARLRILVTFQNGKRVQASLIGNDPHSNLALLRTPVEAPNYLAPAESPVLVAQRTYLIGYRGEEPVETEARVTTASIGASCRDIYRVRGGQPLGIGSVFVVASLGRRVNPGAACVDDQGRLIGVLLGCAPPQVLAEKPGLLPDMERSFVIPGRRIAKVVAALREHGRVIRADFGFGVAPVSDALRAQLPDVPKGAGTVDRIDEKGPAYKAGLRQHDIVLGVNDHSPADVHLLRECLEDCKPGAEATLRILRGGKEQTLKATPVDRDPVEDR